MSATITIDLPTLDDALTRWLEEATHTQPRYTVGISGTNGWIRKRRTEYARAPLWVPYLPTKPGQVVHASEPSRYEVTGIWHPDRCTLYVNGETCGEGTLDRRIYANPGDRINLNLSINA